MRRKGAVFILQFPTFSSSSVCSFDFMPPSTTGLVDASYGLTAADLRVSSRFWDYCAFMVADVFLFQTDLPA